MSGKNKHTIYADTDSCYFTLAHCIATNDITPDENYKNIITLADDLCDQVNKTFPDYMMESFFVSRKNGEIIEGGREVVATTGLYKDVKKRYALHVIDMEGVAADKMKIMGMETRRSDTPKVIQTFLEQCLLLVIKERVTYEVLRDFVDDFRINVWRKLPSWKRGTPCRVSNLKTNASLLAEYNNAVMNGIVGVKKPLTHFSVVGAANTNELMNHYGETRWDQIHDGDKIEILYLKDNPFGMTSVAGKVGDSYVPEWFKELPFDDGKHEAKMVDKKLDNVIGSVLGWSFEPVTDYRDEVFEEVDFWNE